MSQWLFLGRLFLTIGKIIPKDAIPRPNKSKSGAWIGKEWNGIELYEEWQ